MKYVPLIILLTAIMLLTGCKSKKAPTVTYSDLYGSWSVIEVNGEKVNEEKTQQMLEFDTLRKLLSGNAGCNRLFGKIEYQESQKNIIRFLQVSTTRMTCPQQKEENDFLEALKNVVRFAPESVATTDTIAFYGTNNAKLMVLRKK